ncbi:hypothetical protein [Pseudaestuariivita rosea]|uniref:hypothetical protein n=1 Tax=Pseudaestuariivita rosea TaxID=2763263 RepID=UPI001ABAC70D|nr:hypothetical protein [Pseudaestuariivita rosea]
MTELTGHLLEAQGVAADTETALKITRAEVSLLPVEAMFLGGQRTADALVRVSYLIPASALDRAAKEALIEQSTKSVLACGNMDHVEMNPLNVWCIINEIGCDNWGAAGKIWSWKEIKRFVAKGEIALRRRQTNQH